MVGIFPGVLRLAWSSGEPDDLNHATSRSWIESEHESGISA